MVARLSEGRTETKGRFSQSGVKYRTVCGQCNNGLLGAKYDPALISFSNQLTTILKSTLDLPSRLYVRAQPQAILRSLLGHISAQGVSRYPKGPQTEPIRDYFCDQSKPFPIGLHAFYWAYPFRPTVLMRDVAYCDLTNHNSFMLWMMKFFPVALAVTWDEPKGFEFPVHSFEQWRGVSFSTVVDLPIDIRPLIPEHWPEAPTNNSLLLVGQEAIFSVPRQVVENTPRLP